MSTSSSVAPVPGSAPEIQPFPYAEAAPGSRSGWWPAAAAGKMAGGGEDPAGREQRARAAGREEGEARAHTAFDERLAREREALCAALNDFARERAAYYQRVEAEVVQLALNIARKILHRESQIDPLLLAGMVRVVLEEIEGGTEVVVRVHPQHAAEWRGCFARCLEPREVPEVEEDPTLEGERCIVQTRLGATELGLEVQLKEIERGLLDLLAQRPQAAP